MPASQVPFRDLWITSQIENKVDQVQDLKSFDPNAHFFKIKPRSKTQNQTLPSHTYMALLSF